MPAHKRRTQPHFKQRSDFPGPTRMNEAARQAARSRMNHRPCCVLTPRVSPVSSPLCAVCSDLCAGVEVESRARSAPPAAEHRRVAERTRGGDQATRRHDPTKETAHSGIQHPRAAATTTGGSSCDCQGNQRHDEQQHMTIAISTFLAPLSFSAPCHLFACSCFLTSVLSSLFNFLSVVVLFEAYTYTRACGNAIIIHGQTRTYERMHGHGGWRSGHRACARCARRRARRRHSSSMPCLGRPQLRLRCSRRLYHSSLPCSTDTLVACSLEPSSTARFHSAGAG